MAMMAALVAAVAAKTAMNRAANNSAKKHMNLVAQYGRDMYNPFIERGERAGKIGEEKYSAMAQDPQAYIDNIMNTYKFSPGYMSKRDEMLGAAGNTASAGGFRGTGYDQNEQAKMVQDLLGRDMQQYLQNASGVQQTGLSGLEPMVQRGYGATGSLMDILGGHQQQRAGMSLRTGEQNKQSLDSLMKIFGGGGGGMGGGGGGGMGGMMGGMMGGGGGGGMGGFVNK